MIIYYIDPNDKVLLHNERIIRSFIENYTKTECRFANEEEYLGLTCLFSHDTAPQTRQQFKFEKINSERLKSLFIKNYSEAIGLDSFDGAFNMALSFDQQSIKLGIEILIKGFNGWVNNFISNTGKTNYMVVPFLLKKIIVSNSCIVDMYNLVYSRDSAQYALHYLEQNTLIAPTKEFELIRKRFYDADG